jgi:hypothetical protein
MRGKAVLQVVIVLAIMACVFAPTAGATAGLSIFDGATCATSNCVMVFSDGTSFTHGAASLAFTVPMPGMINLFASLPVFYANVETGETKPLIGSDMQPEMDLGISAMNYRGAGHITIQWSDVDFKLIPGFARATAGGTISPGNTATVTYNTYADVSNALWGNANALTTQVFGPGPNADSFGFSGSVAGGNLGAQPYELLQELKVTTTASGSLTGDVHLDIVPEPASVVLLGGILLLTARTLRRRAKTT